MPAAELDRLLEGVFLELVPVVLDAGADYIAAADAVLALVTDLDDEQRARLSLDLGADPLTAPLSGRPAPASTMSPRPPRKDGRLRRPGCGAITVDGPALHDLGASASWELAGASRRGELPAAAGRRSDARAPDALRQISFRFAADDDQFMTIAKLRAARQLWARVAEVVGAPDAGAATVHAVTSLPMMAQRDPWVNMLRTTLAAFAAGVGGADTVLVHRSMSPFPADCPAPQPVSRGGWPATPSCCCWRSRTSAGCSTRRRLVVRRGPHRQLAEQAWKHFQDIESRGGFEHARDDVVAQIAEVAAQPRRRHRAPAHRAHRCQRVPEPRGTAAAAERFGSAGGAATRPGSRRCGTAPMRS